MNGAESLVETLVRAGVEVCFMNPGTSEIHFVETLDRVRGMRGVPVLFEGVASGAADGYARMAEKPACALFHLGPGCANALANLHNACRARVPLVNIVGDHATYHRRYDPPLNADIEMLTRQYSKWLRTSPSSAAVGRDAAEAVASARTAPAGIATLILPSDTAWGEDGSPGEVGPIPPPPRADTRAIEQAVAMLRNGRPTAIILGPPLTQSETTLKVAGRIAAATGAKLLAPFSVTRARRGAGLPAVERVPYIVDQALPMLARFSQFVLLGAAVPAAFFAWRGKPSVLVPEGAAIHILASADQDMDGALSDLETALGAGRFEPILQPAAQPVRPSGLITIEGLAATIAAMLPQEAIVVDESITSGRGFMAATKGCPPHDWLVNTGGSIGIGMPLSIGAAVACPDRAVVCLQADGSGMYTLQALWTAARENLAITILIFANRAYQILKSELAALGGNPGPRALDMLEIGRPDLDWCALARAMGVPARRVETLEALARAMQDGVASHAPNLIEVPL
ncbi:MAG: acetolactate synthase large subunit [Alphaproteobacteria bacterium]|nr:acetolactate synthase large subunit [Alphaproteobacteria bacterium]MBV9693608.1 acetolactate synthase large subunit [Alphaproteobacteria bacterium]